MWLQSLVFSSPLVTEIFQIFLILLPFRALCILAPNLRIRKTKASIGHFGLHVPASIPPGCLLGTTPLPLPAQGLWVRLTPSQATRDKPRASQSWEWMTWGQAPTKCQSHQSQSLVLSFNYWERETHLAEVAELQRHERVQPVVNKLSLCHRVTGSKEGEPLRKQEP